MVPAYGTPEITFSLSWGTALVCGGVMGIPEDAGHRSDNEAMCRT